MYYLRMSSISSETSHHQAPTHQSTDQTDTYDVAVVGYGPGAQALTALLARKGHRVVAFERYPGLYGLPRAGHIDHETMRLVQNIADADVLEGFIREMRDEFVWLNADRDVLMRQPMEQIGDAVSGWYSDYTQWQPHLEKQLSDGAAAAGVEVNFGWECVGVQIHASDVELVVNRLEYDEVTQSRTRSEEFKRVRATYVVGVDGANSFVRTAMGISRVDLGFNESWLDVDLEIHGKGSVLEPNHCQICDPERPRLVMPLGASHRRFEWKLMPGETAEEMQTTEKAWELLKEFGVTAENHTIARLLVYAFQARIAETWNVQRRVLLSGDAAHTMPPFAGQGLLASLRDSVNLAWKLDLVLRGCVGEELIDAYEVERRPHATAWTLISLGLGELQSITDPVKAAERDALLRSGDPLPMPAFPVLEAGVLQQKAGGPPPAVAGQLGLQGIVRSATAEGRFDDVFGGLCFSIVTTGGDARSLLTDEQISFLDSIGTVLVEVVDADAQPGDGQAADVRGTYRSYLEENGVSAVINRPDFYVFGAVADLADLGDLVGELAGQLGWVEGVHD